MMGFEEISGEAIGGSGYPAAYFNQSALATTAPVALGGAHAISTTKLATTAPTIIIARSFGIPIIAQTSPTALLKRAAARAVLVSVSLNALASRQTLRSILSSISVTALRVSSIARSMISSTAPTTKIVKQINVPLIGSTAPTTKLVRQTQKPILASTAPTALMGGKLFFRALISNISVIASRSTVTNRIIQPVAVSVTALKHATRLKSVLVSIVVISILGKVTAIPILAAISATAFMGPRTFIKALLATTSPLAFARKATSRFLDAVYVRLGRLFVKLPNKVMNAQTAPLGLISKSSQRHIIASASATATLRRMIGVPLLALAAATGSLIRATSRQIISARHPIATLQRVTSRVVLVTTAPSASVQRLTGRAVLAQAQITARQAHTFARRLLASTAPAALLQRLLGRRIGPIGIGVQPTLRRIAGKIAIAQVTAQTRFGRFFTRAILATTAPAATVLRLFTRRITAQVGVTATVRRSTARIMLVPVNLTLRLVKAITIPPMIRGVGVTAMNFRARLKSILASAAVATVFPKPLVRKYLVASVSVLARFAFIKKIIAKPRLRGIFGNPTLDASSNNEAPNLDGEVE